MAVHSNLENTYCFISKSVIENLESKILSVVFGYITSKFIYHERILNYLALQSFDFEHT